MDATSTVPDGGNYGALGDAAFLEAVETVRLEHPFGHADHVRLAWIVLARSGSFDEALVRVREMLQRLATSAGKPERYHETLTRFWLARIAAASAEAVPDTSFEALLVRHPELLDRDLVNRFYSDHTLWSHIARREWIEPDRQSLEAD